MIVIIVFLYFNHCYYYHFAHHFVGCLNKTFKNSWYIFSVDGDFWSWNRETCQSQGGDLVSTETEEEWKFIIDEIQRPHIWYVSDTWSIGLTKKAGNWTWVNGRPLTIFKWGKGEPSGEHVEAAIYKRSSDGERGVFGSTAGGNLQAYICEISKGKFFWFVLFYFFPVFFSSFSSFSSSFSSFSSSFSSFSSSFSSSSSSSSSSYYYYYFE